MRAGIIVVLLGLVAPTSAHAQIRAFEVDTMAFVQVDQPPQLLSISTWYFPAHGVKSKVRVVLHAVIDTMGHVEPTSVGLVTASDTTFFPAARLTLLASSFTPGEINGRRVRVSIVAPIVYAEGATPSSGPPSVPHCEFNFTTAMLPPKC
jgi:hypothetical protein